MSTEYHKEYYQKNKKKLLSRSKSRYSSMTPEQQERQRQYQREYYRNNKEKSVEYSRKYRADPENRVREWERMIEKKFGMDRHDYQNMLDEQNGTCAICDGTETHSQRTEGRLSIDHCHTTGKVRGILCNQCNSLLGWARDDINTLQRAIEYLETSNT